MAFIPLPMAFPSLHCPSWAIPHVEEEIAKLAAANGRKNWGYDGRESIGLGT